jgi:prevent-host-death family protein
MTNWGATNAKAKFSALLDAAEKEGPQLIRRRKHTFVVTTEEEFERRVAEAREGKPKKFISAWDALRPSFDERYDVEFPRVDLEVRPVDFD